MPPLVHCVRHGQGFHNVGGGCYTLPDPHLTPLGEEQSKALGRTVFADQSKISLVLASPLCRTLQSAYLVFQSALTSSSKCHPEIIAIPDAQETSDDACDVGTNPSVFRRVVAESKLPVNLSLVKEGWNVKALGTRYSPESNAIAARARDARIFIREKIRQLIKQGDTEPQIALVAHGGFLHYFTEDWEDSWLNLGQDGATAKLGPTPTMLSRDCSPKAPDEGLSPLPDDNASLNVDGNAEAIPTVDESLQARIERLGRERPPIFPTRWSEIIFVFSISMSQFLTEYFVSGFTVILPTLITELNIPQAASLWPATAFSLVIASTLLVFGRLGDMWGGYPVFVAGLAWLLVWSIIAGFSINPLMLDLCRALQGLGAAAALPTEVMLMGSLYRPGPRKNLVFAVYGTSAVFGFFGGILMAGIVGQFTRWGFYFWIGAILTAITLLTSILYIPRPHSKDRAPGLAKMDYSGAVTIVCGLVLIVLQPTSKRASLRSLFCQLQSSRHPCMSPLLLALFLLYGTWGIFSVYGTLYFQNIHVSEPVAGGGV
ncbi:hypothetical protein BN1708_013481, partial [Verticillium longisporum]